MKAEQVIKTLLEGASGVTALVGARIYGFQLPQKPTLPALVYTAISSNDVPPINQFAGANIARSRIQVSAFAADYPGVKALLEQVRLACSYKNGTIATYAVVSVMPDVEGPDLWEENFLVPYQSRDFIVTHYQ